jgi:hypothetical protein
MKHYRAHQRRRRTISAGEELLCQAHQAAQALEQRVRRAASGPGLPDPHSEGGEQGPAPDRSGTPEDPQGGK